MDDTTRYLPIHVLRLENQGSEEQCMIQEFGVVDSPVKANTDWGNFVFQRVCMTGDQIIL